MTPSKEIAAETGCEGLLLLIIAALGWAAHAPLIFASLGPTAYEQAAKPHDQSSRPYNVVVGHLVGLGAGFLALLIANAWGAPKVLSTGVVTAPRVLAVALAALITALGTLLLKARQPAATATSLLIALGSMQTGRDALVIVAGIALIAVLGEPVRRLRAMQKPKPA